MKNKISIDEFKALQKGSGRKGHNQDHEYQVYKAVSNHLKLKYPSVIFHFDYAGNHLTKTQSGKMKAIQGKRGFPDLAIYEPKLEYRNNATIIWHGLFIEIKAEGTNLWKKEDSIPIPASEHIKEQLDMVDALRLKHYFTRICVGTDSVIETIDYYMNLE